MTTATTQAFSLQDILRFIASRLQIPVIILLLILVATTLVLTGWIIAELFTEHRHLKVELPKLLDRIQDGKETLGECIASSGLLKSQKEALLELTRHPSYDAIMLDALAIRLIDEQQASYDRIIKISELVSRLGPMCGLLGTLIPLGPGIIAMGQGDTYTLSVSLLTAFDTTICGLACAVITTLISTIRRRWYKNYMSIFETVTEFVIEEVKTNAASAV